MNSQIKSLIIFLGDCLIFISSLYFTLIIRYKTDIDQKFIEHLPHFFLIFLLYIIIFYLNGLYDLRLANNLRKLKLLAINSVVIGALLAVLYFYLNVSSEVAPKTNLAIFLIIYLLLFLLWRYLVFSWIKANASRNKIAIIGSNDKTEKLIAELKNNPGPGYACAVIIKNLEELQTLALKIKEHEIRTIVLVDDLGGSERLRALLFGLLPEKISFFTYPDFYELLSSKVPVESINQDWFLNNLKEGNRAYYSFSKRLIEMLISAIILLISLPFWPFIILAIKLSSKGPIFFKQTRLGRQSQKFSIYKFRTMKVEDNDLSPTKENDQRITKVGKFLRKTRLDELPQFFNIFNGDMSFIGPRPERPKIVAELEKEIPFYRTRLLVKPGLTGWNQISGYYHSANKEDSLQKLQYDLYYIKNRSLYLDLVITLKTISIVLKGKGR